jgi:hypothetical protein
LPERYPAIINIGKTMYKIQSQFAPRDARTVLHEVFISNFNDCAEFAAHYKISHILVNDIMSGFVPIDENIDKILCRALDIPDRTFLKCEHYYNAWQRDKRFC